LPAFQRRRQQSCESPAFPPGERKYTLFGESGILIRLFRVGYPEKYWSISDETA
jgi:hypothetical protein